MNVAAQHKDPREGSKDILRAECINVEIVTGTSKLRIVRDVDLTLRQGECLALVGESGSGKSMVARSLIRLSDSRNLKTRGKVFFGGRDLFALPEHELRSVRGREIGMIFQDPMSALNPLIPIGTQIAETLIKHLRLSKREARERVLVLLDRVGFPAAAERLKSLPHELSGGMRQRVMIAMAIACNPSVLIADEPTTALDVTVQAQVLGLLDKLRHEFGLSVLLITHDMGVVSRMADRVSVMYSGRIVEVGSVESIFANSLHPYTQALLSAVPMVDTPAGATLKNIPGTPPRPSEVMDVGCSFAPRCSVAIERCSVMQPKLRQVGEGAVDCVRVAPRECSINDRV